ncbi:mitochondrial import receptor subunit TOM22 homolog [Parasteatoda tepidariorum]|uniref:Mitochondrial import receptor subunit TOM22 homolog n=1 Tax=Parasteatoda tepidariorum TaxID=114398 RepID=A0A2L2Y2V5_PARTP|nr:mitochondrial import receptor subunit TOM22 homolog [Parasteatoda tepidariorum]
MPVIEEIDSGIDANSSSNSREDSPTIKKNNMANMIEDDLDDIDETLSERLWALTEMFPEPVRKLTSNLVHGSVSGIKNFYRLGRSTMWVFFTSSAILVAPVLFEMERMQLEEAQRQQQRQILLGPSAAVSGGGGGMHSLGMPMPPHMAHR